MSCFSGRAQQLPPIAVPVESNRPAPPHTPVSGSASSTRRRGFVVAGELGDDGADLLVPGHRQERRRTPVGLRTDEVEVRLRLREVRAPVAATEPQECRFGSTSAAIRTGACSVASSSRRSSDRNDRSGRNPVSTTT